MLSDIFLLVVVMIIIGFLFLNSPSFTHKNKLCRRNNLNSLGSEFSESENSEKKSSLEMIETGSSLNDQIKHADNSVATKFAKQPIGDLRNAFGLNERFLFANELFGGDGQEFIRALNELNHLDNFEDAKKMLGARYEKQFAWKNGNETVIAFVEVVERRYL